jgi:hypothetical protein
VALARAAPPVPTESTISVALWNSEEN